MEGKLEWGKRKREGDLFDCWQPFSTAQHPKCYLGEILECKKPNKNNYDIKICSDSGLYKAA